MTSSNAEIACWTAAICISSQPLTVIGQISHWCVPRTLYSLPCFYWATSSYSRPVLPSLYKTPANFSDRRRRPALPLRRRVNNRFTQRQRDAIGSPLAGVKVLRIAVIQGASRNPLRFPLPHQGEAMENIYLRVRGGGGDPRHHVLGERQLADVGGRD